MVQLFMKSLGQACKEAVQKWYNREFDDVEDIVIGRYEDFPLEEFLNSIPYKYFVDYGVVYLVGNPSMTHEVVVNDILLSIYSGFSNCGIHLKCFGSASKLLCNYIRCGSIIQKRPDFSFYFPGDRRFPIIVGEVAIANESLPLLLAIGATWLNRLITVQFAVLVKVFTERRNFYAEIYLLRRAVPSLCSNEDEAIKLQQEGDLEILRCRERKAYNVHSLEEIQDIHEVAILKRIIVTEENIHGPFILEIPYDPPVTITLPSDLFETAVEEFFHNMPPQ